MTDVLEKLVFDLCDPSDNAKVVFGAIRMLAGMGFDKRKQTLIASAVSELSTNIIRYAQKGTVTMEEINDAGKRGFLVTARDNGPGIKDIEKALTERYTTGKGLGLGLPSVKRIMDEFEIVSQPGNGTCITAKIWASGSEWK